MSTYTQRSLVVKYYLVNTQFRNCNEISEWENDYKQTGKERTRNTVRRQERREHKKKRSYKKREDFDTETRRESSLATVHITIHLFLLIRNTQTQKKKYTKFCDNFIGSDFDNFAEIKKNRTSGSMNLVVLISIHLWRWAVLLTKQKKKSLWFHWQINIILNININLDTKKKKKKNWEQKELRRPG